MTTDRFTGVRSTVYQVSSVSLDSSTLLATVRRKGGGKGRGQKREGGRRGEEAGEGRGQERVRGREEEEGEEVTARV